MTPLEQIFFAIIWIGYGAFAAYQTKTDESSDKVIFYIIYIIFAPLVFLAKAGYGAFYGAFRKYK